MTKTCEIKIDLTFIPTLDKCPSCEVEQEFGNGVAECRSCGYHTGGELSEVWTDFVMAGLDEVPRGYTGEVLQVSDHGNITLYTFTNGRGREVWGLV